MSIENILNYIRISDTVSTSGQPLPNQFEDIANAGFTHVINLATPYSTNALPDEGGFVSEADMNYFHIPVPFDHPRQKHLDLFLKLVRVLDGEKVWVHCALNWRVSAFMVFYQRENLQISTEDSVPMLESWKPDTVWQEFIAQKR